jgi:hypothetical protein
VSFPLPRYNPRLVTAITFADPGGDEDQGEEFVWFAAFSVEVEFSVRWPTGSAVLQTGLSLIGTVTTRLWGSRVSLPPAINSTVLLDIRKAGVSILDGGPREVPATAIAPGQSPRYEIVLTANEKTTLGSTSGAQLWLTADGGTRAVRVRRVRAFLR